MSPIACPGPWQDAYYYDQGLYKPTFVPSYTYCCGWALARSSPFWRTNAYSEQNNTRQMSLVLLSAQELVCSCIVSTLHVGLLQARHFSGVFLSAAVTIIWSVQLWGTVRRARRRVLTAPAAARMRKQLASRLNSHLTCWRTLSQRAAA